MKVCDISVHAFLSVGSCDSSSGFSLALISLLLRFGAVLCAISGLSGKISLRKGSCWTGFQCLCMIRLNLCILSQNCVLKIIFWFFVFTFLSKVCGLSENVMSLISFSTSSFLYPLCFSLWISLIFMFSKFFLFEFVRR